MTTMERHIDDLQQEVRRLRDLLKVANHTISVMEDTARLQLEFRETLRRMDDETARLNAPKKYLSEKYAKVNR